MTQSVRIVCVLVALAACRARQPSESGVPDREEKAALGTDSTQHVDSAQIPSPSLGASACRFEAVERWLASSPADGVEFGASIARIGDVNSDGVADLAVGAPPARLICGMVCELSGRDGSLLLEITGDPELYVGHEVWTTADHYFAAAVCALGDVDADGVDDFAISDPGIGPINAVPPYGAWIVSAKRGRFLHAAIEPEIAGYGVQLEGPGDLDGDRTPDLLVLGGSWGPECVDAISGRTGERLYRVWLSHLGNRAPARLDLAAVEDLDGDGAREFLAWRSEVDPDPRALLSIFSGRTGERIADVHETSVGDPIRRALTPSTCGDIDGDGVEDLMKHSLSTGVDFVSGVDGRVLASHGSWVTAVLGDLDRDGSIEFATCDSWNATVRLFSLRRVP